jgi:predicted lipase
MYGDQVKLRKIGEKKVSNRKHGWKLVGSYAAIAGRLNTVLDLWEVPDPNAVQAVLSDPEFAKYAPQIHEIVEDEVLAILTKLPIG